MKRSGKWSNKPKKTKRMRQIAPKKLDVYKRDMGWVYVVYGDYQAMKSPDGAPREFFKCPRCAKFYPIEFMAMDHIKNRGKYPELTNNPHNWQPLCVPCNRQKYYQDNGDDPAMKCIDYRPEELIAYMELRIKSDWDEILGKFYPDEKSGAW